MSKSFLVFREHSTGSLGDRVVTMTSDKKEIIVWIGTTILVIATAALYIWLSAPEADLLPETYNVM